jgi:hypothetical protein
MKTTIELPDQLMTEVQTIAAREQRKLNDLVAELVRAGIDSRNHPIDKAQQQLSASEWLVAWLKLGEEALRDAPPGPTATEILEADRNRLEPPE